MKRLFIIPALALLPSHSFAFYSIHYPLKPYSLRNCPALPGDSTKPADSAAADEKKRTYSIGLQGASDQAYHGLRDPNQKLPFLEPSFTYTAKSGFYISAGDQFLLVKPGGGFDVLDINPGWDIDFSDNTTLNFNAQYYHFRASKVKSVQLIRSSLAEDLASYLEEDIGNFTAKFTAEYDFYNKLPKQPATPGDIIFTPDASYDFIIHFGKKSKLTITPEANLEFGTRNFYTNYANAKATDSLISGLKPMVTDYSGSANSSFGFIDYNFILTIAYKVGKFEIEPTLTYSKPMYNPQPSSPNPATLFGYVTLSYTMHSKK